MKVLVNGTECDILQNGDVSVRDMGDRLEIVGIGTGLVRRSKGKTWVSWCGRTYVIEARTRTGAEKVVTGELRSSLPGQVIEVFVTPGDEVAQGQNLIIVEAMKMQSILSSPFDGSVISVDVKPGQQVSQDQVLIVIEPRG